jgi:hypothetical protein
MRGSSLRWTQRYPSVEGLHFCVHVLTSYWLDHQKWTNSSGHLLSIRSIDQAHSLFHGPRDGVLGGARVFEYRLLKG